MFDDAADGATDLAAARDALAQLRQDVPDAVRVERLRLLEELKGAVAAAQAREVVAFAVSQRAAQLAAGIAAERAERGIAHQIGLATKRSPWNAQRYLGWCRVLITELPQTYAALRTGVVSEGRALIVARETLFLSREDRAVVDAEVAPDLARLGNRAMEARCRTPYCDAPIRHTDHITTAATGGSTSTDNGQGYCQACNHAKQAPGWTTAALPSPTGAHEVEIRTPTGHTYRSRAPDPPRAA